MNDPGKLLQLRGLIDETIEAAPCDWCGEPRTRKKFIRELFGSQEMNGEPLGIVVTRFYRCERCQGSVKLKAEIPAEDLRAW